ncbi:MAG TPA: hypothetical protein VN886_13085 [Acidimicrobiales bacterium]|nr:hypothetical protein [Acidimicrobiales bacterium]
MSNAKTGVAARGWEIYKTSVPRLKLVGVNEALLKEGLGGIKDRTFRHYHSMDRTGYDGPYITINKWDVGRSA